MTDNEIIKALKCLCGDEIPCKDCAYKNIWFACRNNVAKDTLDLINRQQAEIERFKIENQSLRSAATSYKIHYNKARVEAIREFAERLKDIICDNIERSFDNPDGNDYFITDVYNDIDNLVKEMVGNIE